MDRKIKHMIDNHIHRVVGMTKSGIEYLFTVTHRPGTGEVFIDMNLGQDLARVKAHIAHDLLMHGEYDRYNDYYVKTTKVTQRRRKQHGGSVFPLPFKPYTCEHIRFDFNSVIVTYSEPTISYVESLGYIGTCDQLKEKHTKYGMPAFDDKIALINDDNFHNYKAVLLHDHLINHKYAHNGADEDLIAKLLSKVNRDDYPILQLIHGLCHIYDALYTYSKGSAQWNSTYGLLNGMSSLFETPESEYCFFNHLNSKSADAFRKQGYKLDLPYSFVPDALMDKTRQYKSDINELHDSLRHQLLTGTALPATGTTYDLPNTQQP